MENQKYCNIYRRLDRSAAEISLCGPARGVGPEVGREERPGSGTFGIPSDKKALINELRHPSSMSRAISLVICTS